jgi:hypothetical protein
MDLRFERVALEKPEHVNVIVGQAHFIKTVEDLHETLATHTPAAKFGLAFVESSGPCLVRVSGNDAAMSELAARNALRVGAGHTFYIFLDGAFPHCGPQRYQGSPRGLPGLLRDGKSP